MWKWALWTSWAWAMAWAQTGPEVWLTGSEVPPGFIQQAVARVLGGPGVQGQVPPQAPLPALERRSLVVGHTRLSLTSVPAPKAQATQLLLSNDPENLSASRGLFHYRFGPEGGVRLVYHHKNAAPAPLELHLRLSNPSPEESWVWVSDASAGPVADELYAGHMATKRWLELYWNRAGQLLRLPPGGQFELTQLTLRPGQVGSGLLEALVVQGQKAVLDLYAVAPGEEEPPLETYSNGPVYRLDSLEIRTRQTYRAGGSLQLSLGEGAFQAGNGQRIRGSWGQLHTLTLTLTNPTAAWHTVTLQLSADGGVARGVVWLEGQEVELPLLRPGEGFILGRYPLPPGSQQTLTLSTLPASGSNYPLRLLLYNPEASAGP